MRTLQDLASAQCALYSLVRGGGLRLCSRGFNRRLQLRFYYKIFSWKIASIPDIIIEHFNVQVLLFPAVLRGLVPGWGK
jgi:hypothetical protein